MWEKIKIWAADDAVFITALLLLASAASFGLGRWSVLLLQPASEPALVSWTPPPPKPVELSTTTAVSAAAPAPTTTVVSTPHNYVASRKGSRYHLPNCPSAGQISDENRIWFATKEAAEAAGYTPAANCPGL